MDEMESFPMSTHSTVWTVRLWAIASAIVCWGLVNCLIYLLVFEGEVANEPGKRRASYLARQRYTTGVGTTRQRNRETRPPLHYRLSHPIGDSPNGKFPLLVFLHGSGERGSDNESQLIGLPEQMVAESWRRRFPCYLLAPQCPFNASWSDFNDELIDIIRDLSQKHPVDPGRAYLTGLSMGGFGCWSLAEQEPQLFAAVVPICGGGAVAHANRLVNTPIWAVHGEADRTVPVLRSREMINAVRQAGGSPEYTELKNVGHDSWTQAYQNPDGVLDWMFSQRKWKKTPSH